MKSSFSDLNNLYIECVQLFGEYSNEASEVDAILDWWTNRESGKDDQPINAEERSCIRKDNASVRALLLEQIKDAHDAIAELEAEDEEDEQEEHGASRD